jgi:hypothetical protein
MKYMLTIIQDVKENFYSITVTGDSVNFISFPAHVGNDSYDQFLEQSKLPDKQVKELKPDVWYDFPEGDK